MHIRPELPADHATIDAILRCAFHGDAEARLVAAIRASDGFDPHLSLVAVVDERVVGHILFSPIRIESEGGAVTPAVALAPMAVMPECQRRGIGSALVRTGLEACRAGGHAIVVVLGHAEYYPRFGFERASSYGIRCPFDAPNDAFMALPLVPDALDDARGTVRYPAAFDGV